MFTEYHVIHFILHYLMENIKQSSAPTAAFTVNCGIEQ